MDLNKNRSNKLSITSLVLGIMALLSTPIILIILFFISWALADSSGQPQLSDRITLYAVNASGYILGLIPVLLGSIDLARIRSLKDVKKARIMDIIGIITGIISVLINIIYTYLLFTVWSLP
jgi:membrane associated rhomboid family serine protease